MTRIAIITDTHFGCRSNSEIFIEHHKKFLSDIFFPKIDELKVNTVLHLGDLFDSPKSIDVKTMIEFNNHFFNMVSERNLDLHIIPGNHDVYYKNTLEYTTIKSITSLHKSCYTYHKSAVATIGGIKIGFVPWGSDIFPKCDVLCGHFEIVGFERYKNQINLDTGIQDLSTFKNFKLVLSGHYHHPSQKGNIKYLGAPIEMKWSDYGGPRGFWILDTETLKMEHINNPYKMFRKISYNDSGKTLEQMLKPNFEVLKNVCVKVIIEKCNDRYILSEFLKKMEESNPFEVIVSEDNDTDYNEDIIEKDQDTVSMLGQYIDGLNTEQDKMQIKSFMTKLYNKAEKEISLSQII